MAHSSLLRALVSMLRQHGDAGKVIKKHGISRRQFAAGAAILPALGMAPSLAFAQNNRDSLAKKRIAIIGAGLAGLTAAYRLSQAGARPVVFEATPRIGGRVMTKYNINADGMFCELGGEFINSSHSYLIALCSELGLNMISLERDEKGKEIYHFNGEYHAPEDALQPASGSGAYAAVARIIAQDYEKCFESDWSWSKQGHRFNQMSLKTYLDSLRPHAPQWLIQLIATVYIAEYGQELEQQSALNMIALIGTDLSKPFQMIAESDKALRIAGGSYRLVETLYNRFKRDVDVVTNAQWVEVERVGKEVICHFTTANGNRTEAYDSVICTVPFSVLRDVKGLEKAGISKDKLKVIREQGYGTGAKVIVGTRERLWRRKDVLPIASNGVFYSDLGLQAMWEASRAQPGVCGILTHLCGGKAGLASARDTRQMVNSKLPAMIPGIESVIDPAVESSLFWAQQPFAKGSYICPAPGQYIGFSDAASPPEMDGMMLFAGEHTSYEYNGYMNGAVESGDRAAKQAIEMAASGKISEDAL